MINGRMPTKCLAPLVLLLAAVAYFAHGAAVREAARAAHAWESAGDCADLADEVLSLRSTLLGASSRPVASSDIVSAIEHAALAIGGPPECVARVWPAPTRRTSDSSHVESAVEVDLRDLPLRPMVRFLEEAKGRVPGLRIRALRLTPARGDTPEERWSAHVEFVSVSPVPAGGRGGDR